MLGIEPNLEFVRVCMAPCTKVGLDLDYSVQVLDNKAYLILPGSNSKSDWIQNFNFPAKVYKDQTSCMMIHRGFAKIWQSGRDTIMEELIKTCESLNVTPYILGHSLGGAIALLAAEDYYYRTGCKARVLTFGAPRICANQKTADYIGSTCFVNQYAERNDIVTYLPPFYRHVNPVYIGDAFDPRKLLKPTIYHMAYGDAEDYNQ